jgi:hypothetical protein
MSMNGNLTLTIVDAKDLNSEDHLKRQDPYCKLTLGGILKGTKQTYKTKTDSRGGRNPVWNETHTFDLNGLKSDSNLRISLWDKDVIKDDSIGIAKIPLSELFAHQSKGKHYYQLIEKHHDRRIAGYIGIIAQFDGAGITSGQGMTQGMTTGHGTTGHGTTGYGTTGYGTTGYGTTGQGMTTTTGATTDTKASTQPSLMDRVAAKLTGHTAQTQTQGVQTQGAPIQGAQGAPVGAPVQGQTYGGPTTQGPYYQ